MRKFMIPAAILVSTLATAAPAAAQWAPPGNAYGYNNYGQGRRLEVRVMQIRREIAQLDRRNILSNREARRLDAEARNLEFRIRQMRHNGIDRRERFMIQRQIARLEQRVRFEANDGNRRFGNHDGRGFIDRDRDGRDDRFEDDRGRDHDGRGFMDRDRDGRDDRFEDDRGRDHDGRRDRHDDRRDHDDDDDD